MARALIIGGGLAGLGAALLFRKLGHEVLVLEKSGRPGALARGFQRRGLHFETGFHYAGGLGPGETLHRYLRLLGLWDQGLVAVPLPEPGGERLRFTESGRDFLVPRSLASFQETFPAAETGLAEFFKQSENIFQSSPYLNPAAPAPDLWSGYNQGPSLAQRLTGLPPLPGLRAALSFRTLFYGVPPSLASFTEFALVNTPYLHSAYTFASGGEGLVQAFEGALAAAGVETLTGAEVTAVELDAHRAAAGVRFEKNGRGYREDGDFCLYTGAATRLPALLPAGALRPVLVRRLAGLAETPRPFFLFGLTKSDFFIGRQFFFGPDEQVENWFGAARPALYLSGGQGVPGARPLMAITFLADQITAPWRHSRPGERPRAYLDFKARQSEHWRNFLLDRAPELKGDLEIVASATDLTLSHYRGGAGGAVYGRMHSLSEPPLLPVTRIGRLALAGQDIVMPGLLGVLVSAALAVGVLVGTEQVLEVLRAG